ncbi:MAG: hypothetical protein LT106_18530 [Burkholderiaceae bacterium]|nr:hypothetical protein [Burkholderiaceae bacterium]
MLLRTLGAAAAALFFCGPANAQTLLSGFVSRHSSGDYCESNPGIGIRIDSGAWAGWAAGAYRNSLCRTSVYVAREWTRQVAGPLHVGVLGAVATGYRWAVIPAVLPEVVLRAGRIEVALLVQPLDIEQSPAFAALQLRWRF